MFSIQAVHSFADLNLNKLFWEKVMSHEVYNVDEATHQDKNTNQHANHTYASMVAFTKHSFLADIFCMLDHEKANENHTQENQHCWNTIKKIGQNVG